MPQQLRLDLNIIIARLKYAGQGMESKKLYLR
jgi:hypothetical protein